MVSDIIGDDGARARLFDIWVEYSAGTLRHLLWSGHAYGPQRDFPPRPAYEQEFLSSLQG